MDDWTDDETPLMHGGNLAAARLAFPQAPEPLIDLSTGINPYPYPIPPFPPDIFARLPEPAAIAKLAATAANTYGAPSADHVVIAPGTQILLPLVAALAPLGRAAILSPTYEEHARVAKLVGHDVALVSDPSQLANANLAIVTNPNNPDGRVVVRLDLLALAEKLRHRNGILVVDEAFMDVGPDYTSLADDIDTGNIVVLRSFGKFFGLAGIRLGFAIAAPAHAARLRALLGPWPVSGVGITIAERALADVAWVKSMRARLAHDATRLDDLLTKAGLAIVGGTSLFRLVEAQEAETVYRRLGKAGIVVRRFPSHKKWLRFGMPADDEAWSRLHAALT